MNDTISNFEVEKAIEECDIRLYRFAPSQTNDFDRASLLALQNSVRDTHMNYTYLEIGSYLGGTLQPLICDPKCKRVISIDKRPQEVPDARGETINYHGVTTHQMLTQLETVEDGNINKIETIDADTRNIPTDQIKDRPVFCFIDAEHTNQAVMIDAAFCLAVSAPSMVLAFHDAHIVHQGIKEVLNELNSSKRVYKTAKLGGSIFAVSIGKKDYFNHPSVLPLVKDGEIFLRLLKSRQLYRKLIPAWLRKLLVPLTRPVYQYLYKLMPGTRTPLPK